MPADKIRKYLKYSNVLSLVLMIATFFLWGIARSYNRTHATLIYGLILFLFFVGLNLVLSVINLTKFKEKGDWNVFFAISLLASLGGLLLAFMSLTIAG